MKVLRILNIEDEKVLNGLKDLSNPATPLFVFTFHSTVAWRLVCSFNPDCANLSVLSLFPIYQNFFFRAFSQLDCLEWVVKVVFSKKQYFHLFQKNGPEDWLQDMLPKNLFKVRNLFSRLSENHVASNIRLFFQKSYL